MHNATTSLIGRMQRYAAYSRLVLLGRRMCCRFHEGESSMRMNASTIIEHRLVGRHCTSERVGLQSSPLCGCCTNVGSGAQQPRVPAPQSRILGLEAIQLAQLSLGNVLRSVLRCGLLSVWLALSNTEATGGTKTSLTTICCIQIIHNLYVCDADPLQNELCNSVTLVNLHTHRSSKRYQEVTNKHCK
jgi:hypothetical protein